MWPFTKKQSPKAIDQNRLDAFGVLAVVSIQCIGSQRKPVMHAVRETPNNVSDSGWTLSSGGESTEFCANSENYKLVPLEMMIETDSTLTALRDLKVGTEIVRSEMSEPWRFIVDDKIVDSNGKLIPEKSARMDSTPRSERIIHLIGGGDDETMTIATQQNDRDCRITANYRGQTISASATDFFDAFCHIRAILEKERLIPFCYGASLNVFPSGMCRDMGAGLKAYKFKNGTKPTKSDLVDIFDAGPDVIPVFVSVQREHFTAWLNSIGAAKPPNML